MKIQRVPRFRKNEWGACFYDNVKTIAAYYGENSELLALKILRFNINTNDSLWKSLVFEDHMFCNLEKYNGLKFIYGRDINNLIKQDKLAIIEVSSYFWPGNPEFQNMKKYGSTHYMILTKILGNCLTFVDPYYETKYSYTIDTLRNAFQAYYIVDHNNHSFQSIDYIKNYIFDDVQGTLSDLKLLQNKIKTSVNIEDDIVNVEEIARNFADGMELYLAMLEKYFPNILTTDIMNKSIRIILKWQMIRKNWIKNWDLQNINNKIKINTVAFRLIDEMINVFHDISCLSINGNFDLEINY